MKCAVQSAQLEKSRKCPCAICLKGVGANSIKCKSCKQLKVVSGCIKDAAGSREH